MDTPIMYPSPVAQGFPSTPGPLPVGVVAPAVDVDATRLNDAAAQDA